MSALGLLAGRLATAPARDDAEAGRMRVTTILRVDIGAKHHIWKLTAYGRLADELMTATIGSPIAVAGEISTSLSQRGPSPEINHFLTVRRLIRLDDLKSEET